MQKSSQPQLAAGSMSGQVAPSVVGPEKDRTELYLAFGVLAILGLGIGAYWLSSRPTEQEVVAGTGSKQTVTFGTPIQPVQAEAGERTQTGATLISTSQPTLATEPEIKHADLYFETGRKGLTDEAKAQLQLHAELLKRDPNWGVVLQGYTDLQGSADYNKKLGMKRAEAVKTRLMKLGVPETSIKVVSLGKDGALCVDTSDACNRLNRRVHLELRNVGAEHLAPTKITPAAASDQEPASERADSATSIIAPGGETIPTELPMTMNEHTTSDEPATSQK
jgi:peptidoglycan-associated lipoprotein